MAVKDWTLKATAGVERALGTWVRTVSARMRGREGESGAGFVEYAGIMIIVAGIFVMIDALQLDGAISEAIGQAVADVVGGG
ncbi:hypothetical protein [Streptomyces adelaidensis]|uniref:hypothetical protein n=1 Tax=Streptomyces adelaidensis TaxID=2796465 RepID=UPI0035583B81